MKSKFFILWSAGILSTIIALPYIFALQHEVIEKTAMPLPLMVLVSVAQAAVLLAIAVFFGLRLSKSIQLTPFTLLDSKMFSGKGLMKAIKLAVPIGIIVAVVIKFFDSFFTQSIPQIIATAEQIPFWKSLLVAPYGGVVEELLMRLFFVSLFAWLIGKIFGVKEVSRNSIIMWAAIVLAAVLFGLGHLPATATITQITPVVVARAILLNGIGGLVFGWLYWKKGLEYSIVAHFTTDIVLLTLIPALLK
jgi:membrane protease YdiL (CAAX protease family)